MEITLDNLDYCKEMLEFSEIRHLEGMRGNFEVADEKEYVAVATLQKAKPIPQLIFSNMSEIVEQQQFVFDSFWDKGIPSEHRIRELEKGVKLSVTTIFNEYKKAEEKEFEMIREAQNEIQIIYSTSSAFHLQEKNGMLELLKEVSDQKENLKISMLVPIDSAIKKSLSLALLASTINNNIQIQDITPSIDIKIKSLVVDKKDCLIMEVKDIEDRETTPDIGFSIYSNSLPTVLSYCSIFEMIINQSILTKNLKHEGEIKDDFINVAAHELRTPTQAITGYSELNEEIFDEFLKNKQKMTDEEQTRVVSKLYNHHEIISRNASRLNILTNNLLDVARFESNKSGNIILQKEKVDLVKEINDIIEEQFGQKTRDKGIKIYFINNSFGDHCWVYADKLRLNQILINLIDNAVKFTKRDNSIHIMIRANNDFELNLNKTIVVDETNSVTKNNMNKSEDFIREEKGNSEIERKKIEREEEMVYVGVSDTGKGLSPKFLPKIFEKFATDSDFGTGLGLYITRKLVEAHGGRIWAFNNNDGNGATFVFSLPR